MDPHLPPPPVIRGNRISISTASPQQRRRSSVNLPELIIIFAISFTILSSLYLNSLAHNNDAVQNHNNKTIDLSHFVVVDKSSKLATTQTNKKKNSTNNEKLTSGVGLVTKDGQWDIISPNHDNDIATKQQHDIKLLGFTDANYLPIAKVWYNRLTKLGYKEHYIVANEKKAYDDLISDNYRVCCRALLPIEVLVW